MRHLLLIATLAGCGLPRAPGDDLESRCQMGLDMFEQNRCQPGQAKNVRVEFARLELQNMSSQCKDARSVARVKTLQGACMAQFFTAETGRLDDRRTIRAKYVGQVSALLVDPAYPPAYDRYKDVEERDFRREPGARGELPAARQALIDLAAKHGIDPSHAKELQLW